MIDPSTKIVTTMIHASCRRDYLTSMPKLRVPFELELKAMICFKTWVKKDGLPDEHIVQLPSEIEVLDPTAIITGYEYGYDVEARKVELDAIAAYEALSPEEKALFIKAEQDAADAAKSEEEKEGEESEEIDDQGES